jgi:endonuclease YncB( thermonuclease family)
MHITLRDTLRWPPAWLAATTMLLLATVAVTTHAHPGSLDANSCHKQSDTGTRHCHPERRRAAEARKFSVEHPPRPGDEGVFFGPLVSVTDGDTLRAKVQGVAMDFRLAHVDAPERSQPYGVEAREELLRLVRGHQLVLVPIDTDRYGRTVVELWVGNRQLNRELVRRGYAWFYDEFSKDATLFEIEREARLAKRGLWALPAAQRIEPWRWRREKR